MELRPQRIRALILLFLLGPVVGLAQTLKTYRFKNGVRLAGSSGPKGRLELSSKDSWFSPEFGKAGWSPICDSDDFTDEMAQDMCQMLLYSYGRKFYSPSIAYRKNETGARYVGKIVCTPNQMSPPPPPGRRPPPPSRLPPPPASNGSSNPPVALPVSPPPASPPPPSPLPPARPPPPPTPDTPSTPATPWIPNPNLPGSPAAPNSPPSPTTAAAAAGPSPAHTSKPSPSGGPSSPAASPAPSPAAGRHRRHRRNLLRNQAEAAADVAAAAFEEAAEAGAAAHHHHHHHHHHHRHQRQQRRLGSQDEQQQQRRSRSRSLYSPITANLAAPRSAPYSCTIRPGSCDVKGPFVGIECSHTPLVEAPPPPPSPPSPPPLPPSKAGTIRMYGPTLTPNTVVYGDVEPNLLADDLLGYFYGRFEVQVEFNGSSVWAPLCAPADPDPSLGYILSFVACNQVYDWPQPFDGGIGMVQSQLSDRPFVIPTEGTFGPGDFDPSSRTAWLNVVGYGNWDVKSVQELDVEVTSTPCPSGAMLAAACLPFGERRHH